MPEKCASYPPRHSHWGYGALVEELPMKIGIRGVSCDISPKYDQSIPWLVCEEAI